MFIRSAALWWPTAAEVETVLSVLSAAHKEKVLYSETGLRFGLKEGAAAQFTTCPAGGAVLQDSAEVRGRLSARNNNLKPKMIQQKLRFTFLDSLY